MSFSMAMACVVVSEGRVRRASVGLAGLGHSDRPQGADPDAVLAGADQLVVAQPDALITRDARVLAAGRALRMPVRTPEELGGRA